jgi:cytochrome o ubiquinol oxidase subunit 2
LVAVGASAALLAGCSRGVLDPQGPVGAGERLILLNSLVIMLCIVVPTIAATFAFAWWFRASNAKARRLPDWSFSGKIEMVTWSIPLLVIGFLGGIAWVGSHDLDPATPLKGSAKPLEIQVVSLDWKWLFIYPEHGVASVNRLVVPAGAPLHFTLTSASVMNTFFVPQLGSMIYVMNGMQDQLYLQADHPGTFEGLSGHYSGDGFSDMHFPVDAMTTDAFDAWIAKAKSAGPALDDAAYATLAKPSRANAATTYRSVAPDLFADIVSQKLPPGPGPAGAPAPPSGSDPSHEPKVGG